MPLWRKESICDSSGMTQEEELAQLRAESTAWWEIAHAKHQEGLQLTQDKQTLREALVEVMQAIERLQEQSQNLKGQIEVLQERVKTLEGQRAKDSHKSSLPPSSDRFVRVPKSLCVDEWANPSTRRLAHLFLPA